MIIFLIFLFIAWRVYEYVYFRCEQFNKIKNDLNAYIKSCNELNEHINELRDTYSGFKKINYGVAEFKDSSRYNFKRKEQMKAKKSEYIYDCSLPVFKNAGTKPFKYLCKYFNISEDEKTLEKFENVLNNFSAAEEGKYLLSNELEKIKKSIKKDIPFLIRLLSMKKFMLKLGFQVVDLSELPFPVYTFRYVSPGGNKSDTYNIKLDLNNLNNFVEYLSARIKFKKSIAGQRAIMTSKLRENIKQRDNYTCQYCGVSVYDEKNLLLEIDHIIPLSKGGTSTEDNLQTLCWKCNRSKGSKITS